MVDGTGGWSVWDPPLPDESAVGVRKEAGVPQKGYTLFSLRELFIVMSISEGVYVSSRFP